MTASSRRAAPAILAFPDRSNDRLRRALRLLDGALAGQRLAVAGLQGDLGALAGAVAGLDGSLGLYRAALDRVAAETACAGATARRPEWRTLPTPG